MEYINASKFEEINFIMSVVNKNESVNSRFLRDEFMVNTDLS